LSAVEVFTIIKNIAIAIAAGITAISAAVTAFIAFKGLDKWQKELKGKASFDIARSLARSTYKLRDELVFCRSPFISVSEYPDGDNTFDENTAEEKGDAYALIYVKRWKPVTEAVQEFDTCALEAEALWGSGIKEKTNNLRKCVVQLKNSTNAVVRDKYTGGRDFQVDKKFGELMRNNVSILDDNDPKDPLSLKINSSIEDIENEIRRYLDRS
jgi:hypothetical protein